MTPATESMRLLRSVRHANVNLLIFYAFMLKRHDYAADVVSLCYQNATTNTTCVVGLLALFTFDKHPRGIGVFGSNIQSTSQ